MDRVPQRADEWIGEARAAPGLWVLLGAVDLVVVVAVLASDGGVWVAALSFVVIAAVAVWLARVEVRIDAAGVAVCSGIARWPRVAIPLAEIASVSAADLRPMRRGGWGYRGSRRLFKRAAWIVRAGPGIVLELRDGSRFSVTVEDAETGASLLTELLSRPR